METGTTAQIETTITVPSMWRVLIHNDELTSMEFVIELLMHEFHHSEEDAGAIMLAVHNLGKAQAGGVYTKEVAKTKAKRSRLLAAKFQHPLMVTAERAD